MADNKNGLASPCVGCQELKIGYWKTSNLIKSISFSSNYHCNLECIYCAVWKENRVLDLTKKEFLKNFDFSEFLKHLRELGYIDLDTQVEISAGEITLNPYKKNIFNAVKDYHTVIFSNSLLFDKQIADIISKPGSFLLLSLDSGTRQTYHKIKQKDAFTVVLQNIKKYTCRGGNIQLKYIILPENCTDSDLNGFIELCRACAISTISLSCDIHADHDNLSQEIIDFAIRLGKTARKEGIDIIVLPFFGDENNNFICKSIYCADFVNI
jgi:MoaA/NifB/PqqE/SkfB family radical SAM enzyme